MTELDNIDKKILSIIQLNCRITTKELSEELGLSTTPVFERLKKLEKSGLIDKYVALLNRKKLGKNLLALISITLKQHSKPTINSFIEHVNKLPEVMEIYHTTGKSDFVLKIAIADMEEYQDFIMNKLSATTEVSLLETSFVMSEIKSTTAFYIQ